MPYDEDFGVVLLRVGTQSLEAAAGRGWRNEVAGVYVAGRYFGGLSAEREALQEMEKKKAKEKMREIVVTGKETIEYGSMRIGRVDVGGMVNASVTSAVGSHSRSSAKANQQTQTLTKVNTKTNTLRGLRNEIRSVSSSFLPLATDAGTGDSSMAEAGVGFRSVQWNFVRAMLHTLGFGVRFRALGRFVWAGVGVGWRIVRLISPGKGGEVLRGDSDVVGEEDVGGSGLGLGEDGGANAIDADEEDEEEAGEEVYERFLRGESLSSSDEEDGEYGSENDADASREDEDGDGDGDDEEDEEEEELYADSSGSVGEAAGQSEVLALLADILFPSRASDARTEGLKLQDQGASLREILAHLLHSPSVSSSTTPTPSDQDASPRMGPMTRRRWSALIGKSRAGATPVNYGPGDDEETWLDQRRRDRARVENGSPAEVEARACVVCLAEVREVICWPCRWVPVVFSFDLVFFKKNCPVGAWQCAMGAGRHWPQGVCQVNIGVHVVDRG